MNLPKAGVRSDFRRFDEVNSGLEFLRMIIDEKTSYGIVSGVEVTEQTPTALKVDVSSGVAYMPDKERYEVKANTISLVEADDTNARIDIIYLNADGAVSYYPGTPDGTPTAPDVPTGGQLIAEIAVAANATEIEESDITDKRKLF